MEVGRRGESGRRIRLGKNREEGCGEAARLGSILGQRK